MAREIERKFLVDNARLTLSEGRRLRQGYLPVKGQTTVRLRTAGEQAWLTVKGPSAGAARLEFEYAIPLADAEEMLDTLCEGGSIDKTRYRIEHAGHTWEVDVFHGDNDGLVLAEVELAAEDEPVALPDWVRAEVTGDARYYNVNLIKRPFSDW